MNRSTAQSPKTDFGVQLRQWRNRRRFTQMELASIAGYSQRHLSFLESGRAQPSRETVAVLTEALDVPIGSRNDVYLAAGFAPIYTHEPLDSELLQSTISSMQELLSIHRPFPAILVDQSWNMFAANPNAIALFTRFAHDPESLAESATVNTARFCLDPAGMRPYMVNWREFITRLLANARRTMDADGRDPVLQALSQEMEAALESDNSAKTPVSPHHSPVTHLVLERDGIRLELAALMSYFSSPYDASIAGLKIETFIPVDQATRSFILEIDAQTA